MTQVESLIINKKPESTEEFVRNGWNAFVRESLPKSYDYINDTCVYRSITQDGRKYGCFVGIQLPDDIYSNFLEGATFKIIKNNSDNNTTFDQEKSNIYLKFVKHFENIDHEVLDRCQKWHDYFLIEGDLPKSVKNLCDYLENINWKLEYNPETFEFIRLEKSNESS